MSDLQIHDDIPKSEIVAGIWEHAEVFDFNTEMVFRYLQVTPKTIFTILRNDVYKGVHFCTWGKSKMSNHLWWLYWLFNLFLAVQV
jgi:hypothetical protein